MAYVLWFGAIVVLVVMLIAFMKDAPYFQYREMGIEIDPDALLLACGEELVPTGTALQSLRNAGSDYRTWILTVLYFISSFSGPAGYPRGFTVFIGLSLLTLIFTSVLNRPALAADPAGNNDPAWPSRSRR